MTALAAGLAVAMLMLLLTAGPHPRPVRLRLVLLPAAASLVVIAGLAVGWRPLVPVVVLGVAGVAGWSLRRRAMRGRTAIEVGDKVRECCDALAGELAVGIPPGQALVVAEEIWPPWRQVSTAHQVGGSVPDAMAELARSHPGAGDLAQVGAAWELSHHSGSALAASLTTVAEELADKQATRALVRTELASARSTARLVVGLPVLTLAVGSGNGDPVGWLLGSAGGLVCLGAGLAMALAGLAWIERIAAGVERESA